jgi:hypothetical protein
VSSGRALLPLCLCLLAGTAAAQRAPRGKPALAVSPAGSATCEFKLVHGSNDGSGTPAPLKDLEARLARHGFNSYALRESVSHALHAGDAAMAPLRTAADLQFRLDEFSSSRPGRFSGRVMAGAGTSLFSVDTGDLVTWALPGDPGSILVFTCR